MDPAVSPLFYLSYGASYLANVALDVAWLVLGLTLVRQYRPHAAGLFVVASSVALLLACVAPLSTAAIGWWTARSGGPEAVLHQQALTGIIGALTMVAVGTLRLASIIQLIRPPRTDLREGPPQGGHAPDP